MLIEISDNYHTIYITHHGDGGFADMTLAEESDGVSLDNLLVAAIVKLK